MVPINRAIRTEATTAPPPVRSRLRSRPLLAALLVLALLGTGTAVTWLDDSLEYKVKAACLYNFARFVTWPDEAFADEGEAKAPLVFGILGEDPFGPILDATLEEKSVGGRRVVLRRLDPDAGTSTAAAAAECHVLFVARSEADALADLRPHLAKSHTFCVSELDGYAAGGGVARIFIRNGTTAFEINVDEVERRKLLVSSQLLKLAVLVRDPEGGAR